MPCRQEDPEVAMTKTRTTQLFGAALLLPSFLIICTVIFYPMVTGILYGVTDTDMISAGKFVGLGNFIRIVGMSEFWDSIRFSVVFSFVAVTGSYVMGLIFAMLLNLSFPGRGLLRAAMMIPWVIPSIVSIVSWRWLLGDQHSILNQALAALHIGPIYFLAKPFWAVVSVSVVKIWRGYPFMMVSLLAGLQAIPLELYEAARIDGASRRQMFFSITLPQIKSVSIVCVILMTIYSFNDFDTIWLLTQGGPINATRNLIVLAYRYAFSKNSIGIASAMSILALAIMMVFAFFATRESRREH